MTTTQRLMLASILAAASALAVAQAPATPAATTATNAAATAPAAGPSAGWRQKQRGDRHAKRIERLKAELKLSAAQEGAWNSFASVMQAPPAQVQRPDRTEMAKLSTPERIDRMQAMQAERQQGMVKRMDAVKAFYAQLTPEQQKVFDQRGMGWQGPGKQRGGHGHGHGMMHRS